MNVTTPRTKSNTPRLATWMAAALMLAGVMGSCPQSAWAQAKTIPEWINYQGSLFFAQDNTPINDVQNLQFRLYANQADAVDSALWAEEHKDVQMANGIFNVYLGSGEAIASLPHAPLGDVLKRSGLWLGVKVGFDDEVQPRMPFLSVPFAMAAKHVNTAKHGAWPGTIVAYAGDTAPEGWLLCNGAALSATAESGKYSALYGAIGNTWGGTTDTSFNVPDLRGRAILGARSGASTPGDVASVVGRAIATRLGEEAHTVATTELPSHTHTYSDYQPSNFQNIDNDTAYYEVPLQTEDASDTTGAAGGGAAHNELQPSAAVNYIIKY